MKDLIHTIQEALGKKLSAEGYDIVDLLPIPNRGDRMVRMRTLEEALEEFDTADSESISYLVQIKPKSRNQQPSFASALNASPFVDHAEPRPSLEGIYLPNGKLNISFLSQNAELLYASGDYVLARKIHQAILKSGERTAASLFGIARCLEAEGKHDEAMTHYEESITYHPTHDAYQNLAALLIRKKKDQQAAETMERALNIKDLPLASRFELHKACGNCWMRMEKIEAAEKHYRKALELDPQADGIQVNLGALYLQAGRTSDARRHFQDALASNQKNDRALSGLGSVALADDDKRAAHDFFARALEANLQNPSAIFQLVKCAYEIKSYATAARIVGEYIQVAPINVNLLYSLAGLQFHLGRIAETRTTATKILELQPQHAGAIELLQMIEKYTG